MARLPTSGATVATPHLDEAELGNVLAQLCPDGKFSESDVETCYWRLARIIGQWSAEHDRLDIAPLAKTIRAMGKELKKVAEILSGHETGLHEIHDIAIVSQLATILALDPEIGSRRQADRLIDSFRGDAGKLAHACLVAACDLKQAVGESGRPQAEWHDQFTALLLEVAETAGVKPNLSKDRISDARLAGFWTPRRRLKLFSIHRCVRQAPRLAASVWSEAKRGSGKSIDKTRPRSEIVDVTDPERSPSWKMVAALIRQLHGRHAGASSKWDDIKCSPKLPARAVRRRPIGRPRRRSC